MRQTKTDVLKYGKWTFVNRIMIKMKENKSKSINAQTDGLVLWIKISSSSVTKKSARETDNPPIRNR
jgi:hypothetical protein